MMRCSAVQYEQYVPLRCQAELCPAWWGPSGRCPGKEPLHWRCSAEREHGTHCLLDLQRWAHASLYLLICVFWVQPLAGFNWMSRDGPTFAQGEPQLAALWVRVTAQENVRMTHKRPRTGLLLLSYNPGDQRPFETRSALREAKDRFGYLPCRRHSTHTEANQLSCGS